MLLKEKISCRQKRVFIDINFNPCDQYAVKQVLTALKNTPPTDFTSARKWFGTFNEVSQAISEAHTLLELAVHLDLHNKQAEEELLKFEQEILSQTLSSREKMIHLYLSSPWQNNMHPYENKRIRTELETRRKYSCRNLTDLQIEENNLVRQYKKLSNQGELILNGRKVAGSSLISKTHDSREETRKTAFLLYWRFMKEKEKQYQDIFDLLLKNRTEQAKISGGESYIDLAFAELGRLDYTPKDCSIFRESIFKEIVPVLQKISDKQKCSLKANVLSPWNAHFYPEFMPEICSAQENKEKLNKALSQIFANIHPNFAIIFEEMRKSKLIDIEARAGKAQGTFCVHLQESRLPFIFGHLNGQFKSVMTFIHEFGHALHCYATSHIENALMRQPGLEFCEVASIGLEFLAHPFLSELWDDSKNPAKAKKLQLFNALKFFPLMAMVDEWQHILYRESAQKPISGFERNEIWQELSKKYQPEIDWQECPDFQAIGWLARSHLFTSPFYYIDYGIASLGALQLWQNSEVNYPKTVQQYISGLSIGGQSSLQDLFAQAGISLDFQAELLKNLAGRIEKTIFSQSLSD